MKLLDGQRLTSFRNTIYYVSKTANESFLWGVYKFLLAYSCYRLFFYHNNVYRLVTKILKIRVIKLDKKGHKTDIRHITFPINFVRTINIKNTKY